MIIKSLVIIFIVDWSGCSCRCHHIDFIVSVFLIQFDKRWRRLIDENCCCCFSCCPVNTIWLLKLFKLFKSHVDDDDTLLLYLMRLNKFRMKTIQVYANCRNIQKKRETTTKTTFTNSMIYFFQNKDLIGLINFFFDDVINSILIMIFLKIFLLLHFSFL